MTLGKGHGNKGRKLRDIQEEEASDDESIPEYNRFLGRSGEQEK